MKVYNQMLSLNSKLENIIKRNSQKSKLITSIINDLLDLAKFERGEFKINEQHFNLIELITEAFDTISYTAEAKNTKLFLEFDQKTPFIFKKIYSDKKRILQIILNMVTNSIKFVPKSDGYLKIKLNVL